VVSLITTILSLIIVAPLFHFLLSFIGFDFGEDFLRINYTFLGIKLFVISFLSNVFMLIPFLRKILSAKIHKLFSHKMNFNWKRNDYIYFLPLLLLFLPLAIIQANSYKVGGMFYGLLMAVFILSILILPLFLHERFLEKATSLSKSLVFQTSCRYLFRNKLSSLFTFLCMLFSVVFICLIIQFESALDSELSYEDSSKPSQNDQLLEELMVLNLVVKQGSHPS